MGTIRFMQEGIYLKWHKFVCLMRYCVLCLVVNAKRIDTNCNLISGRCITHQPLIDYISLKSKRVIPLNSNIEECP